MLMVMWCVEATSVKVQMPTRAPFSRTPRVESQESSGKLVCIRIKAKSHIESNLKDLVLSILSIDAIGEKHLEFNFNIYFQSGTRFICITKSIARAGAGASTIKWTN